MRSFTPDPPTQMTEYTSISLCCGPVMTFQHGLGATYVYQWPIMVLNKQNKSRYAVLMRYIRSLMPRGVAYQRQMRTGGAGLSTSQVGESKRCHAALS